MDDKDKDEGDKEAVSGTTKSTLGGAVAGAVAGTALGAPVGVGSQPAHHEVRRTLPVIEQPPPLYSKLIL